MEPKKHIIAIFVISFATFLVNKFLLRPTVVASEALALFLPLVYSLPNFIEAIMGTILTAGILFYLRGRLSSKPTRPTDFVITLSACTTTAAYAIAQEFNLHGLGGSNIIDSNDVIASILGLIVMQVVILKFGFVDQR